MVVVLVVILLITACAAAIWADHADRRRREWSFRAWAAAARELGLAFSGPEDNRVISGMLNGAPVRADFRRQTHDTGNSSTTEETTTFTAGGADRIPVSLVVRQDSPFRALGRLVYGGDEEIGDGQFDEVVEVANMDAWVCAALSAEARRHLYALVKAGGEARQGKLSYQRLADRSHDTAWLVGMLQFFAQLTQLLTVTAASLHQRLADNAARDPSPGVRLRNLRFLTDPSTGTPVALVASTARALLSDPHVPVRLLGAMQLGREGTPVLSALVADAQVETPLRVEALRELGSEGAPGLEPLLAKLLGPSPPELVCTALTIIAVRRLDFLLAAVVECTTSEHEEVRVAAATALGSFSEQAAEAALIRLLSDPSSDVQRASAESLGGIGSIAAVEPLLPLAERLGRAQLRQAARGAIGRIQSRLGHVEAGSLSLADEHELAGAVAIAGAPAVRVGEVSLAEAAETAEGSTASDCASPSAWQRGSSS